MQFQLSLTLRNKSWQVPVPNLITSHTEECRFHGENKSSIDYDSSVSSGFFLLYYPSLSLLGLKVFGSVGSPNHSDLYFMQLPSCDFLFLRIIFLFVMNITHASLELIWKSLRWILFISNEIILISYPTVILLKINHLIQNKSNSIFLFF